MASPLRSPWVVAGLSAGALAFLVWRMLPMFHVGGSGSESSSSAPAAVVAPAGAIVEPASTVPSDTAVLPLSKDQANDSLGGWDVATVRDPFRRPHPHPHPISQASHRNPLAPPQAAKGKPGSRPLVRGLATGPTNLVLAQGRVLAEGDTFAGGVLRAIRPDRLLVRRSTGDTVFFLPRGTIP